MTTQSPNNQIIKEFYRKTKLIQKNQIKTIWEATHIYTGDVFVAKVQNLSQNNTERTVLHQGKFLQSCQGSPGIPFLVWCGKDELQKQAILIQEKLGKTLNQILNQSETGKLSLKSVCMIGIQLIKIIACYHEKGYVHRFINLNTIQFGTGARCDNLYLNDLIDSRSFYKKNTLQHIDRKSSVKLKKATQFTSYDTLDGIEPSRKDDLESIMLVLIYLLKGKLPWSQVWRSQKQLNKDSPSIDLKTSSLNKCGHQNIAGKRERIKHNMRNQPIQRNLSTKQKQSLQEVKRIMNGENPLEWKIEKKVCASRSIMQVYPPSLLCESLPREFMQLYLEVRNLQFTQRPNYQKYLQNLNAVLIKKGLQNDGIYQWMRFSNISKPISQGGLSVKGYEWLMRGNQSKSKLVELQNEREILAIYEKMAPFIQIDKLQGQR